MITPIPFEDVEVRGDVERGYSLWATFNPRTSRELDVKIADNVHPELIRFLCLKSNGFVEEVR